ncbi:uncharacterized protein LOC122988870 [Scomber scombrus]|uniref:Uncharacterized protein LOC122988870 n=1 Tax=Scomber scombrus TaxID=13677 RepID=A0AAV1N836_SCOSC
MAKLLYVRSKPGDDSQLILSERPPLIFHLGSNLKAARLDGGLEQRPSEAEPGVKDFQWESFLFKDPSDPTGLRLILRRISSACSAHVSCPSLPVSCNEPFTADKASNEFGSPSKCFFPLSSSSCTDEELEHKNDLYQ